ncbi:MAG: L-lactate dehydrogenase complex protein LldE [Solirubrobacteraceae bacterium]|jgi:L-lactate dehydrogenase complex protein LldE|nr:L-lactate dehydrogenase complex protein LldE [Solirubrobacteraceae bacterium]
MDRIVVFPTCVGDLVTPQVPERTIGLLRAAGCDAAAARGTTCCGQPAFSAGHVDAARRVARTTLRALDRTDGEIVVVAGSCAAMMRRHWRELFHGDRDEATAARVSARVVETSQALAARLPALRRLGLRWRGRVGYHDSCHMLRELRVADEPREVLGAVEGVELVELRHAKRCCGFGGTFSVRYPGVSVAMADTKLDEISELGLDAVVSCDGGCLMQLGGRADATGRELRPMHLVDLLDEARPR